MSGLRVAPAGPRAKRTAAGSKVKAKLDKREYPTGVVITKAEMDSLEIHRDKFHGEWNYKLRPRKVG
jgi:hypothetical protein